MSIRALVLSTFLLGACAAAPSRSVVDSTLEPRTAVAESAPMTTPSPRAPRTVMPERREAQHILQFLFGARKIDSDFDPADGQFAWGFEYAFQPAESWLGVEAGIQLGVGADDENNVDLTTAEFEVYVGPRMTFLRNHMVQPYVGAGVTLVSLGLNVDDNMGFDDDDTDTSVGFYGHVGIAVNPVMGLRFGFEARAVTGTDITLFANQPFGGDTDADYSQFVGFVGWGF